MSDEKKKNHGIFVTGTDTGVGKTVVAAGIAAALRSLRINVGVMKPVHTGCKTRKGKLIPEDSLLLARAATSDDPIELITPYMFREPAAPYVAAKENNVTIDINKITDCFSELCKRHDYVIVEGIGGVLVPITGDIYVADLIKRLKIPVIIVTRPDLGTINHTMLTISCLNAKRIPLKGIVINNSRKGKSSPAVKTFRSTMESLSEIQVLETIPCIPYLMDKLTAITPNLPHPLLKLANSLFDISR